MGNSENSGFLCLQLFCDILGILVYNLVMNHSDQERLFMVKVLTAFLFSLLIFVFTIHKFPKSITVIKVLIL